MTEAPRFKAVRLFFCSMRLKEQRELRQQFDWIDCPDEILDLLHDAWQAFLSFLRLLNEIGNGLWVLRRKRSRHVGEAYRQVLRRARLLCPIAGRGKLCPHYGTAARNRSLI